MLSTPPVMFSTQWFVLLILMIDLTVVVTALLFGIWLRNNPYAFMGESSPITWLSFLHLIATAGLAGLIFVLRRRQSHDGGFLRSPSLIWFLIAAGFVFLAVDEVTKLHETVDEALHQRLHIEETGLTDRLDDVIVAGYGVAGVLMLWLYRTELINYSDALPLLCCGFLLFLLMVILDTVVNRPDILSLFVVDVNVAYGLSKWVEAVEDGIKVLAEGVFAGVTWQCLAITKELNARVPKCNTQG